MMRLLMITALILVVVSPLWAHRIAVGETLPTFALSDVQDQMHTYPADANRVWALIMLRPGIDRLDRMVQDVREMVTQVQTAGKPFTCVAILSGPKPEDLLQAGQALHSDVLPVLLDPGYQVWGQLGIVAVPTIIVVGKDGIVRWVRPGRSYDMIPAFHAELAQALGLKAQTLVNDHVQVDTLHNSTVLAKQRRHIQMARSLVQKGHQDAALATLRQAYVLDANSVEVAVELAELLCRMQANVEALEVLKPLDPANSMEKARCCLLTGWAQRQLGRFEQARTMLEQALALNASSSLACYQLGQVCEALGDTSQALTYYRQALELIYVDRHVSTKSQ